MIMRFLTRRTACLAMATLFGSLAFGQSPDGVISLTEFRKPSKRTFIRIPEVKGYQVLKADFHMHTVFSDGSVWPSIRIKEAAQEGLDAIAFTEHAEYTPHAKDIAPNLDRPHQLTEQAARENNIILIKGVEITRKTPPGHFNALFRGDGAHYLSDNSSALDGEALKRAKDQNAFVFWNHPGWKRNSIAGSYEWIPFVDSLVQRGEVRGIEVVNGFGIHEKAIDWALERDLTIIGNSDVHGVVGYDYDLEKPYVHRSMTLLLAKERSEAGIREALESGRTIAWASKYLVGKEAHVRDLVTACLELTPVYHTKEKASKSGQRTVTRYFELKNHSDLYFEMTLQSGKGTRNVVLYPGSSHVVTTTAAEDNLVYEVISTFIGTNKHLSLQLFDLKR